MVDAVARAVLDIGVVELLPALLQDVDDGVRYEAVGLTYWLAQDGTCFCLNVVCSWRDLFVVSVLQWTPRRD
jgi:hypothetical protein